MPLIFVYITNPSKAEAKRIALHLIKKKLAACANIYDNVTSLYPWKGKISEETECMLILKTHEKNYNKIVKEVEKIHAYKIPCILRLPMRTNKKYETWLMEWLKK